MIATTLAALLLAAQLGEAAPSAVVSGRVVDAVTGRPIAGAIVSSAGSAVAPPGASSPVRLMTDGGGTFVLRGVSKGILVLTAAKGGYVNAQPGQRRPGGSRQPIRVTDGQRITGVEIRMWKFATIAGVVLDDTGDPIVNTRVVALRKKFVSGHARFEESATAVTDDRGMYRIASLAPADYAVAIPSTQVSVPSELMDVFFGGTPLPRARRRELSREMNAIGSAVAQAGSPFAVRSGGQTISLRNDSLSAAATQAGTIVYPTVYFPMAPALEQASIVTLRSGEQRAGIDLQVRAVRGVRVSGMLMGPQGGLPATAIRLLPASDNASIVPIDVATTMTDWTGAFTFAAVPAGQYSLRVLKLPDGPIDEAPPPRVSVTAGGTMTIASNPAGAPAGPPPIPPDATLVANMPLSVGDSDLDGLVVPLSAAPRVEGRVQFAGALDQPSPSQIVNMRISLDPADGARLIESSLALTTGRPDADGDFRTFGVPPGRYVLRVSPIPIGWYLESAMYQGRDVADLPLDLESKDASGVVITFTDRPSTLSGTVTGARGADDTAVVIAYPTDEAMWMGAPRRTRFARAAEDGSFAIQTLPPGEYYVAAVQDDMVGEWQDPALLRALARLAQTVRIVEGDRKTINLRASQIR